MAEPLTPMTREELAELLVQSVQQDPTERVCLILTRGQALWLLNAGVTQAQLDGGRFRG